MIDWSATGTTPETTRSKDRVTVICERCHKSRQIFYSRAKRQSEHLCISCSQKIGEYVTGQIVTYVCHGEGCTVTSEQQYHPGKQENWLCHHCAMKKGHRDGKFRINKVVMTDDMRTKISAGVKEKWADDDYRAKLQRSFQNNKQQRSGSSKKVWSDQARIAKLSESVKKLWMKPEYRALKTKQNQDNWQDDDYIAKQAAGMAKPETREKVANARIAQLGKVSSIQAQLYKYLDDLGVTYHKEGRHTVIGCYVFDCLIPCNSAHKNILIECQGDYWHSLQRSQQNDRSKFTYIDKYFPDYEIVYVWEHEFSTVNRVIDRLKSKLGIDLKSIDFSFGDIAIKTPPPSELREFLDAYHYIGKDRGGIAFGAYLNNILIGCVVYSQPLRQNTVQQFGCPRSSSVRELSRLCIHPSYHKRNFASWFISRTIKLVQADLVIAYADRTVGHNGTTYRAANFMEHHRVVPDYWYVDGDGFVMHKRTLYGKAIKMKMTESDYASRYGYLKQYGGEKICFIYRRRK